MLFKNKKLAWLFILCSALFILTGCSGKIEKGVEITDAPTDNRSNKANVLMPVSPNTTTIGNDSVSIDITNICEGYITATYSGNSTSVKLQLTGTDTVTYTYNISPNIGNVIPLSAGSGDFEVVVYEEIVDSQYATAYSDNFNAQITNEYGAFLYPNQYVNFTKESKAVSEAEIICADATCDLDAVSKIYNYVVENIEYDHEEAKTVQPGYLPNVDEVLDSKKGICFDYAALMACMLRSQSIPTKLQIGYAGDAYHSWISIYTIDQGWIDSLIEFDGTDWTLMDPTFAANTNSSSLKKFIGDGNNYSVKYSY